MNNIIYGIILYVIIIATLVCTKPSFIYDYDKMCYKEFGTTTEKTIFTLPVIAIFLAIFIAVTFGLLYNDKKQVQTKDVNNNENKNIQYIPIPVYQPPYQPNFLYDPRMSTISMSTSSLSPTITPSSIPINNFQPNNA